MRKFRLILLAVLAANIAVALTASAKGLLPCMVYRLGLTNEQIDQILSAHPDAQLRITAQDWRGMSYQLHRFQNMTNYVEEIGNSNDCARVLLRLHDTGEELSRSNSTLRVSVTRAVADAKAWKDAAKEYEADAAKVRDIRKAAKRAEKNLSKVVKALEQAKKKSASEEESVLYVLLIDILTESGGE